MSAAQWVGLAIIGGYWAVLITTRWMFIARPNRRFTLARIDDAQYHLEPGAEFSLLDEARAVATGAQYIDDPRWLRERRGQEECPTSTRLRVARRVGQGAAGPFIWNGSRDLVAWNLMHRVEASHAGRLRGAELVAALMKAQSQLDDLPQSKRIYWARVLHDQLEGSTRGRIDDAAAQAILRNVLNELYNARDTKFTNLATQQNKVTWLVFTGLVIMAALVSQGYEEVLLAGAVGGILSRLQRELQRRDVPTDYGLSWSVLFLSPVSGALSAWAGLLLLQTLQVFDVVNLEKLLPPGTSLTEPRGAVLGVAILFGISERLLDRLVRQTEDEIAVKPKSGIREVEPAPEPPKPAAAAGPDPQLIP